MPHIQGKKVGGRHTTVIEPALGLVQAAQRLDLVSKIVLGLITSVRGKTVTSSLKITDVDAGLRLKVRGPSSVQEIFLYTSQSRLTKEAIRTVFDSE